MNYVWEFIKIFDEWNKIEMFTSEATNIRAQLVDLNGKFIIGHKNLSPLCQYISKSAVGAIRCSECYLKNCFNENVIAAGYSVFKCHIGLTNFSVPIFLDNENAGSIVGGGVLASESDLRNMRTYIQEMKLDTNIFLEKIKQIKCTSHQNIESAARILKNISIDFKEMLTPYYRQLEIMYKLSSETNNSSMFIRDELTGLLGPKLLTLRLTEEIDKAYRYNMPLCVLFLEIDNLKKINETKGYVYGDMAIKKVVDIIKNTMRKVDTIYRYSGNVYSVLAFNTKIEQAYKLAKRINKILEKDEALRDVLEKSNISVSVGIAPFTIHSKTADLLIEQGLQTLNYASGIGAKTIKIYELPTVKKSQRRVVVTGLGIVSPIGIGKETYLSSLIHGKSGISNITLFDASNLSCKVAGEVKNFNPEQFMPKKLVERSGRSSQFAIAGAKMAIQDAGLNDLKDYDPKRISVIIGSAIAGLEYGEEQVETFIKQGVRRVSPYLSVIVFAGMLSSEVSIELGVKGKSATISTGCTAGSDAIGYAFHEIQRDESDIVITGGAEAPLRPVILASFCTMKAVSTHFNDAPEKASRPFDKLRDGFIMSEGSGIVVLEELQHALRRGAHIYAEVLGYSATDDAFHLTQPAPNGESASQAIKNALDTSCVAPEEIDYINSHGSATPLNDSTETRVIKNVFKGHAKKIPISSTKSMQGHPLGASGSMEFIATVLGMEHCFLPPTINYEYPDFGCDLDDYVTTGSRKKEIHTAISNNFGFGGKNASIVLRKY